MKLIDKPLCPWLGAILLPGLLGACGTFDPKVDVAEPVSARPVASVYMEPSNGSLFQPTAYRPLYENHRARLVGDIINITISEAISAKQETTSSLSKAGTVSSGITAVPLVNVAQVAKLSASGNSSNTFDGKGATASTNTFTGTITTTVIEVLPNGHLIVSGKKEIGVAKNVDVLRFSGQIDPATIQPGNTVASTQVANVRIEQMGRGAQQEAQGIGWLGRFFLNISPF
jgi:flagellar L-ring protein precursor FlgH